MASENKTNRSGISENEEEKARLEAELKTTKQEADELRVKLTAVESERDQLKQKLLTVRKEERQKVERLQEERTEETKRNELKAEEKFVEHEAKLRAEMEALKTQNNQLKTEIDQLQQKPKNANAKLQESAICTKCQELESGHLKDEISAAKQRSAETQLRQLNELRSPTNETTELKETPTELQHQQQQQLLATEEHHQGNYCLTWAYVSTMSKTKT